ncbi:hypothetical protein HYX70_00930 [Candidatus Saccharibacteria bacterium]|nr:hypothetical protein [Candidatus Saccharibacteria bacterium]
MPTSDEVYVFTLHVDLQLPNGKVVTGGQLVYYWVFNGLPVDPDGDSIYNACREISDELSCRAEDELELQGYVAITPAFSFDEDMNSTATLSVITPTSKRFILRGRPYRMHQLDFTPTGIRD